MIRVRTQTRSTMPPTNPILQKLHEVVLEVPPIINAYRRMRDFAKRDPVVTAAYRKLFERRRLTLPTVAAETIAPEVGSVVLPTFHPLFAGEDAPLADMLFLLTVAKGRRARRILEVGTYRARTTLALHNNCPEAHIVSYDIQVLDSHYRQALQGIANVELRHASFAASADILRNEPAFDLVFVDGSHAFEHVIEDSKLAMEILALSGVAIWHDYRHNDYFTTGMRVPEALDVLSRSHAINAVQGTTCAVWVKQ